MPAAYGLCDFALAPSTDPEAFGRTAVEPQAMGKPVLASKHGATVETVIDGVTGWLITPSDVAAWADAMDRAITTTPVERATMATAAQDNVRTHFTLSQMCDQTITVYKALLAKSIK
jgi:glycosyltransferase involved in cell wall biosynthesis